jgi:hypothetical protein
MCARTFISVRFLILVLGGVFLTGCGGKPVGRIAGQVTLNGEPVKVAKVTAYNDKEEILAQSMVIDGNYELADLPLGPVTLIVQTHTPDGQPITNVRPPRDYEKTMPAQARKDIEKKEREGQELPTTLTPVPLKYTSAKQSDLKVTVEKGSAAYDIAMTGKGEMPKATAPVSGVAQPPGGRPGVGVPHGGVPGLPPGVPVGHKQ